MTIALGILAADGIVLAADSEISTNGDVKGIGRKLVGAIQEVYGQQAKSVGVAGAGSVGYFESIRFKVLMVMLGSMNVEPFADSNVEHALENFMAGFHERHVIPYAAFPNPPGVEVLAAGWMGGKGMLLATENAAVRQSPDFEAIGMGGTFAKSILHNYWKPMSVESAVLLAAYTINRVKFSVRDCGKETHIMVMRDGVAKHLPYTLIAELESFLENLARFHSHTFRFLFGFGPEAEEDGLREESEQLRQEIKAIISPISQT